jgi:hypothetical protein
MRSQPPPPNPGIHPWDNVRDHAVHSPIPDQQMKMQHEGSPRDMRSCVMRPAPPAQGFIPGTREHMTHDQMEMIR